MKSQKHPKHCCKLQSVPMRIGSLLVGAGVVATLLIAILPVHAQDNIDEDDDLFHACLIEAMTEADSDTTIGAIRIACEKEVGIDNLEAKTIVFESSDAAVSTRLREEAETEEEQFVITPYLPNYVLFGAYNFSDPNVAPYQQASGDPDYELDDVELTFQLSLKVPLAQSLIGNNGDLYAAYTNRSFWQAYNTDQSSPFRETNHQPEAWMRFYNSWDLWGMRNVINDIGVVHQSNGRGGSLSRSWNRIYARFVFEKENFALVFQPWYRIKEDEDKDNNPDIEDYLGNFELTTAYKLKEHEFSLMVRNNLDSDENRGATQLDWSFPLGDRLSGYMQWFNGYGESLIDYNANVNRVGIGVSLTGLL